MTPAKTASAPRAASAKKAATASKSAKQPVAGARTAKAKVAPSTAKKAASNNSKPKTKAAVTPPAKKATKATAKPVAKKTTKAPAKKAAKAPAKPVAKKATKAPAKVAAKVAAKAPATKAKAAPVKEKAAPVKEKARPATKPKVAKKPSIGPYAKDAKFLEEQRVLLETDRAIYQGQATDLKAEADSLAQEREPGDVQFDEESGEGGTVTVDRERDLALSAQALLAVEEIDHALARIVDKTYGSCERCHQPILKARLRALPYARLCVACKSGGLSRR
jgi:DnaK suppressor protein